MLSGDCLRAFLRATIYDPSGDGHQNGLVVQTGSPFIRD